MCVRETKGVLSVSHYKGWVFRSIRPSAWGLSTSVDLLGLARRLLLARTASHTRCLLGCRGILLADLTRLTSQERGVRLVTAPVGDQSLADAGKTIETR